jgi:hypothetical protein
MSEKLNFIRIKKKQKQQIILLAVFIPIFVIIYIVDQQITKSRSKQLNLEYPRIVYEDSINGVVTDIYHPKGYRVFPYFLRIEINNAKKKSLGITPDSLTLTETLKLEAEFLRSQMHTISKLLILTIRILLFIHLEFIKMPVFSILNKLFIPQLFNISMPKCK